MHRHRPTRTVQWVDYPAWRLSSGLEFGPHARLQALRGQGLRLDDEQGLGHVCGRIDHRSEEHTSELQSLMRISYAVFRLKKKHNTKKQPTYCQSQHTIKT